MPANEKHRLHELVDNLPAEQIPAALNYLHYLSADPMLLALLSSPPDDEPYTDRQRQQDAEAEAAIARGEGVGQDEMLRELGL